MEANAKLAVNCMSALSAEIVAYPITSILTRVQAAVTYPGNLNRPLSSFAGSPSLLSIIPSFLLRSQLFRVVYSDLVASDKLPPALAFCLVSTSADVLSALLRTPFENYRHRLQTGEYPSLWKVMTETAGHRGPLGMWQGLSVYIARDVSFNLLRYGFLTHLQSRHQERKNKNKLRYDDYFAESSTKMRSSQQVARRELQAQTWINTVATVAAAILTTPLDVLKTRVMTQQLIAPHITAIGTLKQFKEDGTLKLLWRGVGLRSAYICLVITLYSNLSIVLMEPIERSREIEKNIRASRRD